jgi:hypothetical protein
MGVIEAVREAVDVEQFKEIESGEYLQEVDGGSEKPGGMVGFRGVLFRR